jgi:N-formylglutamate deformylase
MPLDQRKFLLCNRMPTPAIVIHVPHAAYNIPVWVRSQFVLTDDELVREVAAITDHYVDELFDFPSDRAVTVTYPYSRLVVDPERFEDNAQEPMASRGMGAVYTHTTRQTPLRRELDATEREKLLAEFYRPHHDKLARAVADALRDNGQCVIIDAHSFPAVPLPYELDQDPDRPDYGIGTDSFHTPPELETLIMECLGDRKVANNRPFSGTIVPKTVYQQDHRVSSVMIEINRRLYMTEESEIARSPDFELVHGEIQHCLEQFAKWASKPK